MNRKARVFLALAVLAAALAGLVIWRVSKSNTPATASGEAQYTEAVARMGEIAQRVEASGVVQPVDEIEVRPEVDGTVLSVSVKAGQHVRKGQVLATIDASDSRVALENARAGYLSAQVKLKTLLDGASTAELEQARASLKQSEITAASAQRELERAEALYKDKLITSQQLDSYRNSALSSQEAVRSAKARLDQLQQAPDPEELASVRAQVEASKLNWETLNRQYGQVAGNIYSLKAPNTGMVLAVNGKVGSRIRSSVTSAADLPLVTIIDPARLEVQMDIDETDLAGLDVGQEVTFSFAAFEDKEFRGRLSSIAAEGKASNGVTVFSVTASIDEATSAIRPGMNADATIWLKRRRGVLILPNKAVVSKMGRSMVLIQTADGRKLQRVETGMQDDTNTEIVRGLRPGDRVLIERRLNTSTDSGNGNGQGGNNNRNNRRVPGLGGPMGVFH